MVEKSPVVAYYDQMLAAAKRMHPDLMVRLEHGNWVLFFKTAVGEPASLPQWLQGTPAWELWETPDEKHGNKLEDYRYSKCLTDYPLEYVAEEYNLRQQRQARQAELTKLHLEGAGLLHLLDSPKKLTVEDFGSEEEFRNYLGLKRQALMDMMEEFSAPMAAFEEKWRGSRC